MTKIRIVGGGLDGVLAAFEAHRLGFRDIALHERDDRLGGQAAPKVDHGVEARTVDVRFDGDHDPARERLEAQGIVFDVAEDRCGSVSPAAGGALFVENFAGPALACRRLALCEPVGDTLADRIRAYPSEVQAALSRYAEWRLGDWVDRAHASAAAAMGLERLYPIGADPAVLDELGRATPAYAAFYARPGAPAEARAMTAAPRDGFAALFDTCRRRLESLGVAVQTSSLFAPAQALAAAAAGEAVVWTPEPEALFPALDIAPPAPARRGRASYVFKAEFDGPRPFRVANFTAQGVVASLSIYESRGQTLVAAECIAEAPDAELRREIHRLTAGFGGASPELGALLAVAVRSAETASVERVRRIAELQRALARRTGPAFILSRRVPGRRTPDLAALATALEAARTPAPLRLAAGA